VKFTRTLTVNDLTPGYLRRHYLFGIVLKDSYGEFFSDNLIQGLIDDNIVDLEQKAGVKLTSIKVYTPPDEDNLEPDMILGTNYDELGEALDWSWEYAKQWGHLVLRKNNVTKINRIRTIWNKKAIWTVPSDWIKFRQRASMINIVPTIAGSLSNIYTNDPGVVLVGQMLSFGMAKTYPRYWAIDFEYGIANIPRNAADFICLKAAMIVLEQFATAFNPGISSRSISLGSIFTESQTYTASAMYSLMSAQIETYRKRLSEINENDLCRQLKGGGLRAISV